jgi:hypothetical protein
LQKDRNPGILIRRKLDPNPNDTSDSHAWEQAETLLGHLAERA